MTLSRLLVIALPVMLAMNSGCRSQKHHDQMQYQNALVNETSPYLLQHAHNPVDWYPWSPEALAKAQAENKLLIISVGYSACHWCHVMERESFEDTSVASIMNEHFVSIKVDREERPDIDDIYMTACHLINRSGGWPLNAIALPDGRPVFAGTYYPKKRWINLLETFADAWQQQPDSLIAQAENLTRGIREGDVLPEADPNAAFSQEDLDQATNRLTSVMDFTYGGRKKAPKFPMPDNFLYLLDQGVRTGNQEALKAVEITLDEMAKGGIYDQIGGGFARYSVDERWHAPHFEKMLYDNGQLVSLYSKAYLVFRKPRYKEVVEQTLAFIQQEMTHDDGFYSALDADSEGEEGKFYIWRYDELAETLGSELNDFAKYYGVSRGGNWEHGKNILHQSASHRELAARLGTTEDALRQRRDQWHQTLMTARDTRIRPGLDDKMLTSWNALMLRGYAHAYKALGNMEYLEKAIGNAKFLTAKATHEHYRLTRNYKDGKARINAFLDDYALLIDALIELYQVTLDEEWLDHATGYLKATFAHFSHPDSTFFYYTSNEDPELAARKTETGDNVIAASNSSMAMVLHKLGLLSYREDWIERSARMLSVMKPSIQRHPEFYSNWAMVMDWHANEPAEVAIVGPEAAVFRQALGQHHLPGVLYLGGTKEGKLKLLENKLVPGKTMIYVCRSKACGLPVDDVDDALKQLQVIP